VTFTAESNGITVPLDASTLDQAKQEARDWASYGAGVTLCQDGAPIAYLPFSEGGFIGDGQGSRTFSHGPWQAL
jgi:hypothetical protein